MDKFIDSAPNLSRAAPSNLIAAKEILPIIRRRMWVILASVVSALILVGIPLAIATPSYTAELQILLANKSGPVFDLDSAISGQLQDEVSIVSEVGVLKSRGLAKRVVDRLNLTLDEEFNQGLPARGPLAQFVRAQLPPGLLHGIDNWLSHDESTADATVEQQRVIERVVSAVGARQLPRSRIVAVTFTSAYPAKAATILNTLADLYFTDTLRAKFENAARASKWLAEEVQQLKDRVHDSENAVEEYRRAYGLFAGEKHTLVSEQISDLSAKLTIAKIARRAADASLAETRRLRDASATSVETATKVLDSPLIQRYRQEQMDLERKEADYSQKYGPRHPEMIQLQAEKDRFLKRVVAEIAKISLSQENEARIAREQEAALSRDLGDLKQQLAKSNEASVGLKALERDAEANRLLLEKFLGNLMEANAQKGIGSQVPDGRLVSSAFVPDRPSFPKTSMVLTIALVAGAAVGLLLALALEYLDAGFRSAEQVTSMIEAPVLAHVPLIETNANRPEEVARYVVANPESAFADSMRSLHTRLQLAAHAMRPRVVLLISSVPGEGKTSIAIGLARQQAQAGRHVVLVDCDVRRSQLVARIPGLATAPGFRDVIAEVADLDRVIQRDPASPADIIVAGRSRLDPFAFAQSQIVTAFFDALRDRYELVVVDAPPILALSDGHLLERMADSTLMVVRWGATRRQVVRYAAEQIRQLGGEINGVILTMVNVKKHAHYSYGDSGYYSGSLRKYYSG